MDVVVALASEDLRVGEFCRLRRRVLGACGSRLDGRARQGTGERDWGFGSSRDQQGSSSRTNASVRARSSIDCVSPTTLVAITHHLRSTRASVHALRAGVQVRSRGAGCRVHAASREVQGAACGRAKTRRDGARASRPPTPERLGRLLSGRAVSARTKSAPKQTLLALPKPAAGFQPRKRHCNKPLAPAACHE